MGFNKKNKKFVNRTKELKDLGVHILNAEENSACIMYSEKGVGKSALIEKLLTEYNQKHRCFSVKPKLSTGEMMSHEGEYIQEIFKVLYEQASAQNSWADFLKFTNRKIKKLYKSLLGAHKKSGKALVTIIKFLSWILPIALSLIGMLCTDFKKPLFIFAIGVAFLGVLQIALYIMPSLTTPFMKLTSPVNKAFEQDYLLLYSDSTFDLKLEYIKYVLSYGGILLYLDNIESIDRKSLNSLAQCINCCSNKDQQNYFLLEYNNKDLDVQDKVNNLKNTYTNNSEIAASFEMFELHNLDNEHVKEIASDIIKITSEMESEILLFWHEKAKGNIFELVRHINNLRSDTISNSVIEEFATLTERQKFVLLILIYSGGEEEKSVFEEVLSKQLNLRNLAVEIKILTTKDFIQDSNNHLKCNADIIKDWDTLFENQETLKASALSTYEEFYISRVKTSLSTNPIILDKLLHFYCCFKPSGITSYLTYIKQYAKLDLKYLKSCFVKIYQHYNAPESYAEIEILQIASCCYDLELYQLAFDFIKIIQTNIPEKIAYEAMLLHRLDCSEEAINYCHEQQLALLDPRLELILLQVEMISQRMLYNINECWLIFNNIKNNNKFLNFKEYGFFLRNAQIVLNLSESIPYIKRSIKFFKQRDDNKNAALSQLTYGMQLARMGHLYNAKKNIEQAQKIISDQAILAQHYFDINLAAIHLLSKTKPQEIEALLSHAELTAHTIFDRLVILTNRIAYCILKNDFNNFKTLVQKINTNEVPYNTQVFRSIYYNIAMMYKRSDHLQEANDFLNRSKQCHDIVIRENPKLPLNPLWEARYTHVSSLLSKELLFMYNQPYHVSFISFWHFDIPNF